jgi:hypothetical protein
MILEKYSLGIGDRFGRQGKAQLQALIKAKQQDGIDITPVWNKSHREHEIIGTAPAAVRAEADAAVAELGWDRQYCVDADHISAATVDAFVEASDFFTLDVADFIGKSASDDEVAAFVEQHSKYIGSLEIPGIDEKLSVSKEDVEAIARKYLLAVDEAAGIYHHIESDMHRHDFVAEVSMDETDQPQTPVELFFILAAIAEHEIPAQTIAPKFSGRFNKGVDYVGDVAAFAKEFEQDVLVIKHAIREFGLSENLKLSVHSGSDKFSIYGCIGEIIKKHKAGLHLKTAGTTWLEELIGLAVAGGEGLAMAKDIYLQAYDRNDELCGPYASVVDIDSGQLPSPETVLQWSSDQYANALRHDLTCKEYNLHLRQLLHVGYKVAAEIGEHYLEMLDACEDAVSKGVTENLYDRHIKRIWR